MRVLLALSVVAVAAGTPANALTTSLGQSWDYEPDAWTRTSDADTGFMGWDLLESSSSPLGFGNILDDSTPDLGVALPGARFYQGTDGLIDPSPTDYGHRSGSGNYYSGFAGSVLNVDDTITGAAPASGTGGYTTLLVQAIGQPGNPVPGIELVASAGWTKVTDLYNVELDGTGVYWQEWTAPGDNLAFSIDLNGPIGSSSYALDAFTVDTYWTDGQVPVVNTRTQIGVPEPSSVALVALVIGVGSVYMARRRFDKEASLA